MLAFVNSAHEIPVESLALHQIVSQVQELFQPITTSRSLQIVNEIPPKIVVNTSQQRLTSLLSRLLKSILKETYREDIHISAKMYSNLILVHVKKSHSTNPEMLNQQLKELNALAEELGGCISINCIYGTTISLTFLNQQKAAA